MLCYQIYLQFIDIFYFLELLHIRLTRPDGSKYEVLSEASLEGRLPPSIWHHLAISVHDSVHSGKVIIEVIIFFYKIYNSKLYI